jgi:hypothetical protein
VIFTTAIVSVISDEEQNESASYVSSKIFANNDGTHVGLMAIATIVNANETAWSIQETDVIENNNFTGEIDPWLLNALSIMTVPNLGDIDVNLDIGMLNVIFVLNSDVGDNQVVHSVSVAGNALSEGPVAESFDLGQPMGVGAVTVAEMVTLNDGANLTKQTSISVMDNEFTAYNASLVSGVEVFVGESMSNPIDGLLNSTVNVNLVNNTLESWYGDGVGLGFAVTQELNGGKGEGKLSVDVVATNNTVNGFGEGIFAGVDTTAINMFGDVVSNVNILIRDNEVGSNSAIEVDLETSAAFEHYFPHMNR